MIFITFFIGQVVYIIKCMLPTVNPSTNIDEQPYFKNVSLGVSLLVWWLKNLPCNAGDMGSIPGLGRSHMPQSNLSL